MFLLLVVCRYVFSLVPLPADIASSPPSDNVGSLGSAARRVTYNQETKYQRKQNVSLSLVATTTSYPLLIRADAAFYLFFPSPHLVQLIYFTSFPVSHEIPCAVSTSSATTFSPPRFLRQRCDFFVCVWNSKERFCT